MALIYTTAEQTPTYLHGLVIDLMGVKHTVLYMLLHMDTGRAALHTGVKHTAKLHTARYTHTSCIEVITYLMG